MKIHKGDKVKIISGKDKGAEGVVEKVFLKTDLVLVSGVNMVTKHMKPKGNEAGGIIQQAKPIHVSNVMFIDEKLKNVSRLGYKNIDDKKTRFAKKSGEIVKSSK